MNPEYDVKQWAAWMFGTDGQEPTMNDIMIELKRLSEVVDRLTTRVEAVEAQL